MSIQQETIGNYHHYTMVYPIELKLLQNLVTANDENFDLISASFRIVADGGINRWFKFCESVPDNCLPEKYPDIVSGDFDSATEENLQRARDNGVKVVHTPDQDKTDFTKALELLAEEQEGKVSERILGIVGFYVQG